MGGEVVGKFLSFSPVSIPKFPGMVKRIVFCTTPGGAIHKDFNGEWNVLDFQCNEWNVQSTACMSARGSILYSSSWKFVTDFSA